MTQMDRRRYLGSSDIAAVVGFDKRRTPYDLWCSKTATEPPPPIDPKLARFFRRRTRQEPVVAEMLAEEGIVVTRLSYGDPNRYKDAEHPWMAAEIDFEFLMTPEVRERYPRLAEITDGTTLNGEIKTHIPWMRGIYGDQEAEEVPVEYAAQVYWGMMVTNRPAALVTPLFGVDDLLCYPILRDDETIGWLRREAIAFWQLVETRIPPDPRSVDDIKRLYTGYRGKPVAADEAIVEAVGKLFTLRAANKANNQAIEDLEFQIFDHVRKVWGRPGAGGLDQLPSDDALLTYGGRPIASWREQRGAYFDQKQLKIDKPEIVRAYTKQTQFRVLRAIKT